MEIKITNEKQNQLLERREVTFEITHLQTKGTPQRLEIRNKLAEALNTKPDLVYVKRVETKTGTMKAAGEANAYESMEQARLIEPEYIVNRNILQEKKEKTEKE